MISWCKSEPTMASSIPSSARNIPRRAGFGWLRPRRPRRKREAGRAGWARKRGRTKTYRAPISPRSIMGPPSGRLEYLPGVRDQTALDDLVGGVEGDPPRLPVVEVEEQAEDVARVELGSLQRH